MTLRNKFVKSIMRQLFVRFQCQVLTLTLHHSGDTKRLKLTNTKSTMKELELEHQLERGLDKYFIEKVQIDLKRLRRQHYFHYYT